MFDVLLVDNEPAILQALTHCISWENQDCRIAATARDGAEAVQKIQAAPPDIVISDIRMSEMDGLALAKWVADHHPEIKVILLTGFPDFTYAQQAINYRVVDFVLKPTGEDKLIAALDAAKARIAEEQPRAQAAAGDDRRALARNLLLHQLIFDANPSLIYTLSQASALKLDLSHYRLLRFGVSGGAREAERIANIQQAQHIWEEAFAGYPVYFVPRADRFCYIVLCAPAAFDPLPVCRQAIQTVTDTADFQMTAGVSASYTDPLDMPRAAREADAAQQFAEYSAQMPAFSYESLPVLSEAASARIIEELRLLQSALDGRNRAVVLSVFDRLFAYLRREDVLISSVERIGTILHNYGQALLISYNLEDMLSDAALLDDASLFASGGVAGVEKRLRAYLEAVLDTLDRNPTSLDRMVFDVKQYIDQHFDQELSLEALAERVHLSASYLSKLFKKEVGQNISSYIQFVRIERAKVLLRTTNKKTYEIAEAVGICDPVYFSKIFKKTTGKKPKEFRGEQP